MNHITSSRYVIILLSDITKGLFMWFLHTIWTNIGHAECCSQYQTSQWLIQNLDRRSPLGVICLPTAREDNVFTGICHSVHNRPRTYSVTALPRWLLGHLLWCGWYASYWNTSLFNLFLQVLGSVAFLFHPGPLDIRELFTNSLNSLHLFKPPSICLYYGTGTTMQSLQESIPVVSVLPACTPRSNEQVWTERVYRVPCHGVRRGPGRIVQRGPIHHG